MLGTPNSALSTPGYLVLLLAEYFACPRALTKTWVFGRCKNGTSTFFGTRSSKGSETPYVRNSDSVLCLQMFGYALMDSPQRDRRECQVPRSTVTWRFFTPWSHPPRSFIIQTLTLAITCQEREPQTEDVVSFRKMVTFATWSSPRTQLSLKDVP